MNVGVSTFQPGLLGPEDRIVCQKQTDSFPPGSLWDTLIPPQGLSVTQVSLGNWGTNILERRVREKVGAFVALHCQIRDLRFSRAFCLEELSFRKSRVGEE